jgi:hypothetical protein
MEVDRVETISGLLIEAEKAHGAYEATELNGVYDEAWPRWYAGYLVEHGIGEQLSRDVSAGDLAEFLAAAYADFDQAEPKPTEPWSDYVARRMAAEL